MFPEFDLIESTLTAVAAIQPCYYEELAAARTGTATTVSGVGAILDWPE